MSSDKVVLMPAISYTVANAKKDIGNLEINLSNYVKKETLEIIIESLVSDEELAEKLKDYVNKVFMNNALDDYVTNVLLNEKINNFTTYAYVQDVIDNVSTITDQMLAIETTLTNKSDVGHTHTTADITDMGTSITTKKINVNTTSDIVFPVKVRCNGSLSKKEYIRYLIGDDTSQAIFGYGHNESNVPLLYMKLYGKKASIDVFSDIIMLDGQTSCNNILTATNITADNETRLATCETTLTNKADIEHTHSINDITDYEPVDISNKADINHTHSISDIIDYEPVDISTKADIDHSHTSSQLTDLSDLKIEIFKMIYPIGSIYISLQPLPLLDNVLELTRNLTENINEILYTWNGCKWQYIDNGLFLRNGTTCLNEYDGYMWESGAGETGREAEHTLTVDEMPSHDHAGPMKYDGYYLTNGKCSGGDWWETIGITTSSVNVLTPQTNGGNQPHNNLPPYLTVYMYKRIA